MLKRAPSGEWSEKREGGLDGSWFADITVGGVRIILYHMPTAKKLGRSGFGVYAPNIHESVDLQATTEDEAKSEAVNLAWKWLQEASNAFGEWLAKVGVAS